jgi:hypothetical protein
MTAATVSASTVISPHTGLIVIEVEFTSSQNGNTLDITTLDGGEGATTIIGVSEWIDDGAVVTASTFTGTVVTIGGTDTRTMVIFAK